MLKYSCKLQEEKIPPKPFVYEYGHVDPSGLGSAKTESQDADGVVRGKKNILFSIIILKLNLCRYAYLKLAALNLIKSPFSFDNLEKSFSF